MTGAYDDGKGKKDDTNSGKTLQLDENSPKSSSQASLPPLLMLPLELKLQIFSYLRGPEPTLIILRRTHPSFRNIIPKYEVRAKLSKVDYRDHLLAADQLTSDPKQPKLFLQNQFPCFACLSVLPSTKFSDRNTYGPKRVGAKHAHKRFCINCGLKGGCYQDRDTFKINRVRHTVVRYGPLIAWAEDGGDICVGCGGGPDMVANEVTRVRKVRYHLRACETGPARWKSIILNDWRSQLFQMDPSIHDP
ncbi:hypothetical protein MMC28_006661 [Mycoblastus sanguinarius]|nr:hypothetical protein [Mycoblastus sanguinarius]